MTYIYMYMAKPAFTVILSIWKILKAELLFNFETVSHKLRCSRIIHLIAYCVLCCEII